MKPKLLSSQKAHLESLIGHKLTKIKRQIFISDKNLDNFEQMADGSIEITLDDSRSFYFISMVTPMSIGIASGSVPKYGSSYQAIDPSQNKFWQKRLNQRIRNVYILQSRSASESFPYEFALKLEFQNEQQVYFELINEKDWPETLRIVESASGSNYVEIDISHSLSST